MVDEPSVEDTVSILRGIKNRYEVYHGVKITDAALVQAAVLSNRYISDRFLPDKAIDLVDEACASIRTEMDSMPTEMDQLRRRMMQLEIEQTALKKEKDTLSKERREKIEEELSKTSTWMNEQSRIEPLTADITYDPYDEKNHTLSFTIRNLSSDKVDGFRCCMKMYGYKTPKGKDYIEWISAGEIEKGVWRAQWNVPVDQADEGIGKLQPTCMVDGARSNVLDLHFYHLKYDAGGGNCEWYECDAKGEPIKD
jgi:ATP-dependent Clp protease ATP-binding subunit ClpA